MFRKTLGSCILLTGLALAGVLSYYRVNDLSLWFFGRHTTGWVIDLWMEAIGDPQSQEKQFQYFARYQFVAGDDRLLTGESRLGAMEWSGLMPAVVLDAAHANQTIGEQMPRDSCVKVVYFPLYPQHNRIAQDRLIPVLACAYLPLLGLCWACFMVGAYLVEKPLIKATKYTELIHT